MRDNSGRELEPVGSLNKYEINILAQVDIKVVQVVKLSKLSEEEMSSYGTHEHIVM